MKSVFAQIGCWQGVTWISRGMLAVWLFCVCAEARAVGPETNTITLQPLDSPASLDAKRLFALGMIETGNDDSEVGAAGEVSRFQIHPTVWKAYSKNFDYRNPEVSVQVAQQHWAKLAGYFAEKTGRQPSDFDMYVLWNTRYGYYANRGFLMARLSPVVKDRAERFVNLVNRRG
jgi:hypothetical protein